MSTDNKLSTVLERLDLVLSSGCYDDDRDRFARVALELCELLLDHLDDDQRNGVDAAKASLSGFLGRTDSFIEVFSQRIDEERHGRIGRGKAAINRLVFSALSANTGLTDFAGEALVHWAAEAGLHPDQIDKVLIKHLPELSDS